MTDRIAARMHAMRSFQVMDLVDQAQRLEAIGKDIVHMGKRGLSFVSDCSLLYSCNQAMQMCLIFQSRTGISLLVCAKRS